MADMTNPLTTRPDRGPGAWLRSLRADRALRRTLGLALGIAVAATLLLVVMWPHLHGATGEHRLPWWVFALAFAGAEIAVFHVELRREAHTFTLAEVPLVIGLFFAGPAGLIVGRMLAEAVILGFKERLPPRKLALNLAAFLGECAVALGVFHLTPGTRALERPLSWVIAFAAVVAAELHAHELVPELVSLTQCPHPLVAAFAKQAARKLGAPSATTGTLDEIAPFVTWGSDCARLEAWTAVPAR
jgi:hypothetical protein